MTSTPNRPVPAESIKVGIYRCLEFNNQTVNIVDPYFINHLYLTRYDINILGGYDTISTRVE